MSSLDSLSGFASLAARLGEAFADRAALLLAAGLDEAAWTEQVEQWRARLAADTSGELSRRFAEAYAAALAPRRAAPTTSDPRFLTTEAQPWRDEAALVGTVNEPGAPPPALPVAAPTPTTAREQRAPTTEQTQDCPAYRPPADALPFERPAAKAACSHFPGRRLHRFDPQTGQPLAAPVWVDLPLSPSIKS